MVLDTPDQKDKDGSESSRGSVLVRVVQVTQAEIVNDE